MAAEVRVLQVPNSRRRIGKCKVTMAREETQTTGTD